MRKLRGNGEKMGKWRESEEMESDSLSTFPEFLFISYLSIHFPYLILVIIFTRAKFLENKIYTVNCPYLALLRQNTQ